MAELVDDHIVDHLARGQHEAPVERECAARGTRAPQCPLGADPDPPVGDADPPGLCIGDLCDQPPRPATPIRFAQCDFVQPEARYLAAALLLDPPPPIPKYLLDLPPSHPLWNDKPDRLTPASLQSPSPRPGRAPNLDHVACSSVPTVGCGEARLGLGRDPRAFDLDGRYPLELEQCRPNRGSRRDRPQRATRAHAGEAQPDDAPLNRDQLDPARVGVERRPKLLDAGEDSAPHEKA
jgi:hypothetical protein